MKSVSEWADLCERDGQRHSFSKVCGFAGLVILGVTVPAVLIGGGHFGGWDVAALALPPLIPHAYGLATKFMRLKWEKPAQNANGDLQSPGASK